MLNFRYGNDIKDVDLTSAGDVLFATGTQTLYFTLDQNGTTNTLAVMPPMASSLEDTKFPVSAGLMKNSSNKFITLTVAAEDWKDEKGKIKEEGDYKYLEYICEDTNNFFPSQLISPPLVTYVWDKNDTILKQTREAYSILRFVDIEQKSDNLNINNQLIKTIHIKIGCYKNETPQYDIPLYIYNLMGFQATKENFILLENEEVKA